MISCELCRDTAWLPLWHPDDSECDTILGGIDGHSDDLPMLWAREETI